MGKTDWTPLLIVQAALAAMCIIGLFVVAALLFFVDAPKDNQQAIFTVIGGLMTVGFASIIGFFFGQKEQGDAAVRQAKAVAAVLPPAEPSKPPSGADEDREQRGTSNS